MAHKSRNPLRRVPRWLWLCALVIAGALVVVNLTGCGVARGFGEGVGGVWRAIVGTPSPGGGTPGPPDDGGSPLSSLWSNAARSFARIDWWLGLGSGISVLTGVYRLLRGDVPGGVLAVAVGVGLLVLNAIVAVVVPFIFPVIALVTFGIGGIAAYRLAKGRGIGGHTLKCIWARVASGPSAHRKAHEVEGGGRG